MAKKPEMMESEEQPADQAADGQYLLVLLITTICMYVYAQGLPVCVLVLAPGVVASTHKPINFSLTNTKFVEKGYYDVMAQSTYLLITVPTAR